MWAQRANGNWMKFGDQNAAFFMRMLVKENGEMKLCCHLAWL